MLQVIVSLALLAHEIGHVVGFSMPVPLWFTLLWLLPGAAFTVGVWGA